MRGEYDCREPFYSLQSELPPRARRIHTAPPVNHDILGTTSACAENTPDASRETSQRRNYLRVRGEYRKPESSFGTMVELPPRARRIQTPQSYPQGPGGTTSACAENTSAERFEETLDRNYLRVRGEYCLLAGLMCSNGELPPRARRIPPACCH